MNLTSWAIKNNRVTIMCVFALIVSGLISYFALPKAQNPSFIIRTATITTFFPGASAERVEQLISDAIEEELQEMPEIDEITSESRSGISIVSVNFKSSYMEMLPIYDDMRQKVEDMTDTLPSGATTPVINDEFGDTFGHVYTLTGYNFAANEMRDMALDIRDILLNEPDIAKVDLYGDIEETIYIDYDNARLTELGVSPQQLEQQLQSLNILSSGGNITIGSQRINLEPTGNFDNIADLKASIIEIPNSNALIRLGDIAEIYRDYEDPITSKVSVAGTPGIAIAMTMREGGDILTLGDRLDVLIPQIENDLPIGVALSPIFLQSKLTGQSVNAFVENLVQAVLIVIVVMVISLGLRTGFVVASLIPVVMVSTFVVMAQFNIGIDQISLAALIIALGLLVDNAIVVVEGITVRRENGEEAISASINTAKEMMGPLLISSLTTAAAFTPIAMAKSEVGEFTASIFYVVTIALLLSWIMSMTFIPMLSPLIKTKLRSDDAVPFSGSFYTIYRRWLHWSVRHPLVFCLLVIGLFFAAIYSMRFVPQVFIPPSEDPYLTATFELPLGTDIEATETSISQFEEFLTSELLVDGLDNEAIGVTDWIVFIGNGGPRFVLSFTPENPNEAVTALIIRVNSSASLDPVKLAIERYFFENQPNMQVQLKRLGNGPPVSYPIELKIIGSEFDELYGIVDTIKNQLWQFEEVTAIKDTWGPQTKKFVVDIDQARAFRAGVTSQDIATSLNASLVGMELTEFREGDEIIPITMRTKGSDRDDLIKLENLSIFSQSKNSVVPLSQVANIDIVWEPGKIERLDRKRNITIQVQLQEGVTAAEVSNALRPWLDDYSSTWKFGYAYEEGGETDESDKAGKSIAAALPFACFAIVLLLMLQFNSFRRTAIVLITIPLGLIGIVAGLIIAQSIFGFFTLLGLISLAGIVINNAIVLLDRIKLEVEENGLSEADAVIEACQQRARPILLTTATTVGGMVPLWLSGGPMFEPMAIAILFGLLFATFITLLLVPVTYSAFFRVDYS